MTRPESTPGSAESRDELRLRHLLESSMAGVEPDDRLNQILQRTKVTTMSARRSWMFGAGGAALATAAVLTAVAMIGNPLDNNDAEPQPEGSTTPTQTISPTQATEPTEPTHSVVPGGPVVGVYYLGDTPQGERLYREFEVAIGASDPLNGAVFMAVNAAPFDPDYRNPWPLGTTASGSYNGDFITVDLQSADGTGTALHDRPAGMTAETAHLAIQQLIFTAQGAVGEGRVPVQLLLDGGHSDQVLGEATSEPLANDAPLSVLSMVSLSDPSEGLAVSGTLHVTGVASSFEANVPWQLLKGTQVVDSRFFTAAAMSNKLEPFEGDIDVSHLAPGTYVLRIQEDDPSGGEGPGPMSDTRTIVVE